MLSENIKKHLKKLTQKKYREEMGEFTVEGIKGVKEALETNASLVVIVAEQKFFEPEMKDISSDLRDLVESAKKKNVAIEFASAKDVNEIKTTETFPGILAVVKILPQSLSDFDFSQSILCLDGVKDPGNMGTIIRTADWFGIKNILLGGDCVDPYNEKVVRSTMGSIFRTTLVESNSLQTDLEKIKKQGYSLVGLQMHGVNFQDFFSAPKTVYIFGSESHGISPSVQTLLDKSVTIPRIGASESLNVGVAVGIVLSKISL